MYDVDKVKGKWTKEYVKGINSGEIVIGQWIGKTIDRIIGYGEKYKFNQSLVDGKIRFIETQTSTVKGKAERLKLSLVQKTIMENMYGWVYTNETGKEVRLVNELPLVVARGFGKTSFAAALATMELVYSQEYGSSVAILANTVNQAEEGYSAVRDMFRQEGTLINAMWQEGMVRSTKTGITYPNINGKFEKRAIAVDNLDGLNLSMSLFDELHAYKQDPIGVVNDGSRTKRDNWTAIYITTNGTIRGMAMDNRMAQWKRLLTGEEENDRILPFIYQIDSLEEADDEESWEKAQPHIKVFNKYDTYRTALAESKHDPEKQAQFVTKLLNFPLNGYSSYFGYEESKLNSLQYNDDMFRNTTGTIGVDLSERGDLSALTFLTEDKSTGDFYVKTVQFLPRHVADSARQSMKTMYYNAESRGELVLHEETINTGSQMWEYIIDFVKEYKFQPTIAGLDAWGAQFLMDKMTENRLTTHKIGMNVRILSDPLKSLKTYIQAGKLIADNELLSWNFNNVVVKVDANGNIFPNKEQAHEKIDGMMSVLFAFIAYQNEQKPE